MREAVAGLNLNEIPIEDLTRIITDRIAQRRKVITGAQLRDFGRMSTLDRATANVNLVWGVMAENRYPVGVYFRRLVDATVQVATTAGYFSGQGGDTSRAYLDGSDLWLHGRARQNVYSARYGDVFIPERSGNSGTFPLNGFVLKRLWNNGDEREVIRELSRDPRRVLKTMERGFKHPYSLRNLF